MSDARLRIALFSPGWPPKAFSNGIVTYVDHLRTGLQALGHEVHVLASQTGPLDDPTGIIPLDTPELSDPLHRRLLERAVPGLTNLASTFLRPRARRESLGLAALQARGAVDLMEIEESFGVSLGVRARPPVPRVVRLHGPWAVNGTYHDVPRDRKFALRSQRERQAALEADGVTAPSAAILARVREAWETPLPDARVIGNPAPEVAPDRRWTREGAKPGEILFVGRFDRVKGADVLFQGFARLAARRPEVTLRFAGTDGTFMDATGRHRDLEGYLAHEVPSEIASRIQRMGRLSPEAVAELRREAAVTVVSSRHETFSMTAIEAMAHGSPLVASRIPAVEEFAVDGVNARLFPSEDPEALARSIESVLDDPDFAAAIGAQAAADVAAGYSPRVIAKATADFYQEVRTRDPLQGGGG